MSSAIPAPFNIWVTISFHFSYKATSAGGSSQGFSFHTTSSPASSSARKRCSCSISMLHQPSVNCWFLGARCQPPEVKLVSRSSVLLFADSAPDRRSGPSDTNDRDQLPQTRESESMWDSSWSWDFWWQLLVFEPQAAQCQLFWSQFLHLPLKSFCFYGNLVQVWGTTFNKLSSCSTEALESQKYSPNCLRHTCRYFLKWKGSALLYCGGNK